MAIEDFSDEDLDAQYETVKLKIANLRRELEKSHDYLALLADELRTRLLGPEKQKAKEKTP